MRKVKLSSVLGIERYTVTTPGDVWVYPNTVGSAGLVTAGAAFYAAGPPETTGNSTWLPILGSFAKDNRMAWIPAASMVLDPGCKGVPTVPVRDTCAAVESDAADLVLSDPESQPHRAESIVIRTVLAGCEPGAINEAVARALTESAVGDPVTRLQREVWALVPFLS